MPGLVRVVCPYGEASHSLGCRQFPFREPSRPYNRHLSTHLFDHLHGTLADRALVPAGVTVLGMCCACCEAVEIALTIGFASASKPTVLRDLPPFEVPDHLTAQVSLEPSSCYVTSSLATTALTANLMVLFHQLTMLLMSLEAKRWLAVLGGRSTGSYGIHYYKAESV